MVSSGGSAFGRWLKLTRGPAVWVRPEAPVRAALPMPQSRPLRVWGAPGVPDAVGTALQAAQGLVVVAAAVAEVAVAAADAPPPALPPDGPALVALGDPRTADSRWLEVEVDTWSTTAAFVHAPERVARRAAAARRVGKGRGDDELAWLDAVRTVTSADGAAAAWPDEIVAGGDGEAGLAASLAAVTAVARAGWVVVPSAGALRERFGVELPVDGVVGVPIGARTADGVLLVWVRTGGSAWVREAVPSVRAVAAAAHAGALERRLAAAETSRRGLDRLTRRLLSVVGHDLRNPLFAVQLAVKVLEREHGRTETIATLHRATGTATQLVRRLVDAGRQVLDVPSAPPPGGVSDLREALDRSSAEVGRLRPDVPRPDTSSAPRVAVAMEPSTLERVLTAVLDNAVVHGTGATVRVDLADGRARIEVRNVGRLPFSDLDRLEPFEHRANGGLGVGLYCARRLAAACGATLEVRPEGDYVLARLVVGLVR